MNFPKTLLAALLPLAFAPAAFAQNQEMARVISSTPVVQQVAVPHQVCTTQPVAVQTPKSGAGAVMGALAGGAIGNAIGNGSGRALATMIGLAGGAVLGDQVEGGGTQVQNAQQCGTQTSYENQITGYNVVYEYAGKQYSVQLPQDPGPTLALQITPAGITTPQPAPTAVSPVYTQPAYVQPAYTQPVYVQPAPVIYGRPYYGYPYYSPIGVSLNLGYSSRHWR